MNLLKALTIRSSGFAGHLAVLLLLCVLLSGLLTACQKNTEAGPALPEVTIGIVGANQPKGTVDLLAGYIPEDRTLASEDALLEFDRSMLQLLKERTGRKYIFIPFVQGFDTLRNAGKKKTGGNSGSRGGALAYWTREGKQAKVDVLIVPHILDWQERVGGEAGVTEAAAVNLDFYLIDVRGQEGVLVARSHFQEKQEGLANNLMNFDTFLRRGAKWLTTGELAMEGMEKMIVEFGL